MLNGTSWRWWVAALALGVAGLLCVGVAMVVAAPARTAVSAFELTVNATWWDGPWVFSPEGGTFRSRAPFCAKGTFDGKRWPEARFTCSDGSGSVTVLALRGNTAWRIVDGSGSYADLRGSGWMRGEALPCENCDPVSGSTPWRGTFQGVVDRDAVAPTLALSSVRATKLPRTSGAYALRLRITLRDNVEDNPVSYTLRASAGGRELARRFGTARTKAVSLRLRIRPHAGARTIRLQLTGMDPVGNEVSVSRALSLPR